MRCGRSAAEAGRDHHQIAGVVSTALIIADWFMTGRPRVVTIANDNR
jgi:hypothetical protein